ncbi:MAG: hypothetical protein ABI340_02740 [Nitrososphaera sp.]|jgi:hypothetical protein
MNLRQKESATQMRKRYSSGKNKTRIVFINNNDTKTLNKVRCVECGVEGMAYTDPKKHDRDHYCIKHNKTISMALETTKVM